MAERQKSGLSFGFSKRTESRKLQSSAINDNETDTKEETDYLVSVEENKIKSVKPAEEKVPLVIPLIQNNRWRQAKRPEDLENESDANTDVKPVLSATTFEQTGDEVTDEAIKELLSDAVNVKGSSEVDTSFAIPLLMLNKVPDGYETDEKLDVSLRPDEATEEDYEKVPIEQFGMAMLRGMGWKAGEGIGRNKQVVKVLQPVVRPKGLGLGADKSVSLQSSFSTEKSLTNGKDDEKLEMRKGTCCVIISGKQEGRYGTISGIDEDNARAVVTLAIGGEVVTVSQYAIKLVAKKEFDKYSKYLNKGKVDRYKEKEGNSESQDRSSLDTSKHSDKHKKDSSRKHDSEERHRENSHQSKYDHRHSPDRDVSSNSRSHKHRNTVDSSSGEGKAYVKRKYDDSDKTSSKKTSTVWLRPNLRVRIVDKSYKNGKYFKTKVTVVDVISADSCICRTDSGHVLDDLTQSRLETVIPHQTSTYVMIVSGKYQAQVGQLLERNKEKCQAVVQLLSDRDVALTLDFDAICEYTADVAVDDFNY